MSLYSLQEMQQSMNMLTPKQNMPDLSEWLTQKLSGGKSSTSQSSVVKKPTKNKAVKKQQ